jgi:hypothetical protein
MMARDFDDVGREEGDDAIRAALDRARWAYDTPAYSDEPSKPISFKATPFTWRAEADIPRRRWLYGKHLIRSYLSLDIAAGGIGKSSVKIGEALAMTTGRNLYGKDLPEGPLNVWLYNLEDPAEETERRLHATAKYFQIKPHELANRLYADSGRDQALVIAEETDSGARIMRPVVDALVEELRARRIDVLILDPFVSSHSLNENDNRAIDMVAKEWARISGLCDMSINLVHHIRKQPSEATADSSRGAKSLTDACRSVIVYNRMSKEEAEQAGISPKQARFHFRIQNDKANLAPMEDADWFRMNNVELENGDDVGVACSWQWPDAFEGVTTEKLKEVQRKVAEGEWREDVRAKEAWVGNIIAQVLAVDPVEQRKRISKILKEWVTNGQLIAVVREDRHRKEKTFIEVGTWVVE